jgi:excisionase family DNA binding protein
MSNGKTYLNVKSASLYLGVSRGVLYKMVKAQAIPHHKIGQKILFIREELDQWIERKTIREKEERVTAEEKLLRRLEPFWNRLSIDTQDEINERIDILHHWLVELERIVTRVEESKGNCHFRESDCLLKKQTQPKGPDPKSLDKRAQTQPTSTPKSVQAGLGSHQRSEQNPPRRPHIRRKDRSRMRHQELTQQKPAPSVEAPPEKDPEKGPTPSTRSPEGEKSIGVEAPALEEKSPQEVPKPQEQVPAESPSSSTAPPLDQPVEDPLSHAQTVDSAGP